VNAPTLRTEQLTPKYKLDAAARIIAIGDVHGGFNELHHALKISGCADDKGRWTGGDTVVVQMGDFLDRGSDESRSIEMLRDLRVQAKEAGGDVITLLGNHEIMNADLDFSYAPDIYSFDSWHDKFNMAEKIQTVLKGKRAQLMQRGKGKLAMLMSTMPIVVQIGENVFVHGGLTPETISHGIDELNQDVAKWLRKDTDVKPWLLDPVPKGGRTVSPLWERVYGMPIVPETALSNLDGMLDKLDAKRMVVGHTPQKYGISGVETDKEKEVWRIDTNLNDKIMGRVECLEILTDLDSPEAASTVRVLSEDGRIIDAQKRKNMFEELLRSQSKTETAVPAPLRS